MRKRSRRGFLKKVAGGSAALGLSSIGVGCRSQPKQPRRPNILFCISDDQSYPHASAYGARFLRTSGFDRVAREGILFHNAYVSTPSCCPSRGSVLTGQDFYRLREASMNHTHWPSGLAVYPDILAAAGYHTGYTGKGWAPGNWEVSDRSSNPAGPSYNQVQIEPPAEHLSPIDYAENFNRFLAARPEGAPFCFWVGFSEPHREFDTGVGTQSGSDPEKMAEIDVPDFLPDSDEVRGDLADYAYEIEYFDGHLNRMLETLERAGELENTLIVVTSDNGMAFPRAKATVYDYGTRMPLAVRWGERVLPGRVVEDFVSFTDFAPTFLEAASLSIPDSMTGKSFMPLLLSSESGQIDAVRDHAVFGIERHFPGSRPDGAGYPIRAIRTREHLYIRNQTPELNPVGDLPGPTWPQDDPTGGFGDTDGSPTKTYLWKERARHEELARLAFDKRPAEELYLVENDPFNLHNRSADPNCAAARNSLAQKLKDHLKRTKDPRALGEGHLLDTVMRRYPVIDRRK